MKRACVAIAVGSLVVLGLGGCPVRTTSSTSSGTSTDDRDKLTTEREAAVSMVVELVVAACEAFAPLNALTDDRLDLDGTSFGNFGTCPVVTFVAGAGSTAIIQLDFGDGCTAAATGATTVAGRIDVNTSTNGNSARIQYSNLTIGGREVTGVIDVAQFTDVAEQGTLASDCDIETADVGQFRADATVELADAGQLVLSAEDAWVSDGSTFYIVDIATVTANPFDNDNLIPESGSLSFLDEDAVRINVEFSRRSAEEGVVRVTVGNGSTLNYTALAASDPRLAGGSN